MKNEQKWDEEVLELRKILKGLKLDESVKWGLFCYSIDGKNVVIIQPFKSYLAVLFFKGLLLKDPKKNLVKVGKNSRIGRQILFNDMKDVKKKSPYLKALVKEAVKLEEAGVKVPKSSKKLDMPEELKKALAENAKLKKAFESLTPGRQRAYVFFISSAKLSVTRETRIRKCVPKILSGKGLTD